MNQRIVRTSFRRNRRHFGSLLVALSVLVALAAPACSSKDVASGLSAAEACAQNSDCAVGLICALGKCRAMCATAVDCGAGGSCISSGKNAVCEYPADKNKVCTREGDCPTPLACASDYRCRNLCSSAADCNVLGITGRVCAEDANGVLYCADPSEVVSGRITIAPPPTAPDSAVLEPYVDAEASMATDASNAGDAPATTGEAGGTSPEGGTAAMGDAAVVCSPPCGYGKACSNGACVTCGAMGDPCCDGSGSLCGAGLSCGADGLCECGNPNEVCCNGNSCQHQISCVADDAGTPTCACGLQGATCCPGEDGGAPSCASAGLTCAGIRCSCVEAIEAGVATQFVRRLDGTFWASYNGAVYTKVQWPGGATASAMAASGFPGVGSGQVGCGILGGAVWCFPTTGSASNSVDLGAGLGPTDATSNAVQVVTSVGVSPTALSGAVQIAGGSFSGVSVAAAFCAVTSDGSIWCWGRNSDGMLGHGDTADAGYARQVLSAASTPFTNAAEVSVGYHSACARKMDGSVWCWGDNTFGELGSGSTMPAMSAYPVRVSLLGSATRLVTHPRDTYCAVIQGTSVVCWGQNGDAQAGAPSSSSTVGPTSVLVAVGGAALGGVVAVAPDDEANAMCASTTGSGLVCWGSAVQVVGGARSVNPYPAVAYDPGTAAPIQGIGTALTSDGTGGLTYLNPYGLVVTGGAGAAAASVQPTCN